MYSLDSEFRYVNFNRLLKNMLLQVYNIEISVGDIVFDFLYRDEPEQAEEWREIYARALNGEAMQFVKEFVFGRIRTFVKFYVNPIKEHSLTTGLFCMAIDITKERNAETAIARNESRFRALTENNFDGIMVRDINRSLVYASPSMSRMIGFSQLEVSALTDSELTVHEHDVPKLKKLYEDATRFPGIPFGTRLRMRHRLGHHIWIEGVMTNMLNVPNVNGFVCNFRDITERVEVDTQNEMISRDLVKRNENLEQYAYIVAHNLRGPVANLLGLANLIELPSVEAQDRERAVQHLISSARRLDEVIKDLSSILQMNEEINQHKESIDFEELTKNVTSSIENVVTGKNVKIEVDFSQCPKIVSIKSYLYSVFHNLISNSIKYRKDNTGTVIRIHSKSVNGKLLLVFEDNGLGMDLSSYGDKIFGLYRRFHPFQAEGKGMGLFMVKTQVEKLGGKISVQSSVGKGTVFTIEL